MKKFIIMSLAFFALALVGCKKDKDEGEDGGETAVAQTQEECEKSGTMKWHADKEAGKQCVAKTEDECKASDATKVEWKDGACVKKDAETTYSISNGIVGRTVTVSSDTATKQLAARASATAISSCVLVKASQVAKLKVVVDAVAADATKTPPVTAQAEEVLCDNTATPKKICHEFNGMATTTNNVNELRQGANMPKITENCTEMLSAPAAS